MGRVEQVLDELGCNSWSAHCSRIHVTLHRTAHVTRRGEKAMGDKVLGVLEVS